jgi:fructose-1,6-bisphosphatase I
MTTREAAARPMLSHHLRQERAVHPALSEELAALLGELGLAGKIIAWEVARAALSGRLGYTGETNVQGEQVKQLDRWSNEAMVDVLRRSGLVCTMVSEEMEKPLHLDEACPTSRYLVCFDPVDGSSNTDINGILGTIFGIRPSRGRAAGHAADALGPGTAQVAAGYIMYGPATVLVYTAGHGVHGLTLDTMTGEYVLTHPDIRIPPRGKTYSVNEGNWHLWGPAPREFVTALSSVQDGARPYSLRYVGSLVADFHRTLLEGGIYFYPAEAKSSTKVRGKLRLLYEAAPLALVAEQAGGRASTGTERILDVMATEPHQRVPLWIGSSEEVGRAEAFHRKEPV